MQRALDKGRVVSAFGGSQRKLRRRSQSVHAGGDANLVATTVSKAKCGKARAHDVAAGYLFGAPWRGKATRGHGGSVLGSRGRGRP
jgi:hypothetical protein